MRSFQDQFLFPNNLRSFLEILKIQLMPYLWHSVNVYPLIKQQDLIKYSTVERHFHVPTLMSENFPLHSLRKYAPCSYAHLRMLFG